MSERVFIVWAKFHRRSELLAQHLETTLHYTYYGQGGQFSQAPVRYLVQAYKSWRVLRKEKPKIIFVQNPPIFSVMVVALYARLFGAEYIIDSHTGAFYGRRWGWSVGLHRMLSKRALVTIVHNKSIEKTVQRWGCPYLVVGFTPGDYPDGEEYPLSKQFNIAVICAFAVDEPLEILFDAASRIKDVNFYLTGNAQRLEKRLLDKKPENIHLTGYLSYEKYIGLLRGADAVMDLVNNEHTLLMGGFEAVSLGVPLIVSDWPVLRDYFSLGTVYVPNTVDGICEGVQQAQRDLPQLRQDILRLQENLQDEWVYNLTKIQDLLNTK